MFVGHLACVYAVNHQLIAVIMGRVGSLYVFFLFYGWKNKISSRKSSNFHSMFEKVTKTDNRFNKVELSAYRFSSEPM